LHRRLQQIRLDKGINMTLRQATLALILLAVPLTALAQLRAPTNQFLIPAAGDTVGANGTHFRSDITLTNFRDIDQRVQLQWIPNTPSTTTPMPAPRYVTLPAHSGVVSEDFATEVMQQTGLGAILIAGVTASSDPDSGALLYATARIWSPQPGSTGSVSQSFPVVPVAAINPASQVIILGQRIDSRYRTNVGIVNLESGYSRTFDIGQSTDDPTFAPVQTTLTVPPMAILQVPLQSASSKTLQITITARAVANTPPGPANKWVAYGSTVDNATGDSWSNLAMPLLGSAP
jgi:hypothetical protein